MIPKDHLNILFAMEGLQEFLEQQELLAIVFQVDAWNIKIQVGTLLDMIDTNFHGYSKCEEFADLIELRIFQLVA